MSAADRHAVTKWARGERFPNPLFANRPRWKHWSPTTWAHLTVHHAAVNAHKHAHVGALVSDNNYHVHSFRAWPWLHPLQALFKRCWCFMSGTMTSQVVFAFDKILTSISNHHFNCHSCIGVYLTSRLQMKFIQDASAPQLLKSSPTLVRGADRWRHAGIVRRQ